MIPNSGHSSTPEPRFVRWAKYDGAHFVESDGQGGYSVYLHDEKGSYPFAVCGDGNDAAAIAAAFNRIRDLQAENERLREALMMLAPHPSCIEKGTTCGYGPCAIALDALGFTKEDGT